ncbi:MAG: hypothetical protein ABR548_04015 [Actinomycetota bacterium]
MRSRTYKKGGIAIRLTKRAVLAAAAIAAGLLFAAPAPPAYALGSVSMTTARSATISGWTLVPSGANTRAAGSIGITATGPYLVTVSADRSRMTEYVTASAAYATTPKTLGAALSVLTTTTSGLGIATSSVSVGTSATTIATGVTGTDAYSVSLSQPTAITDRALASGRTYHIALTYTASTTV